MKHILLPAIALSALAASATTLAAPAKYTAIRMEINVAKPAKEVWAKVGPFCAISKWLKVDCKIVSGDGGIGTVRSLAGGRVTEVLVGKTGLSYGYTQPVKEGQFYNLYHGYLEAMPVTRKTCKLIYTVMYDTSHMTGQAAKADEARRRKTFEGALKNMKELAEAK